MVGSGEREKGKDPEGEGSKGSEVELETWATASTLLEEEYEAIKELYDVAEIVGARLRKSTETVRTPEEKMLRFPVFNLLKVVINHYGVSISQIYPIGICRIIHLK